MKMVHGSKLDYQARALCDKGFRSRLRKHAKASFPTSQGRQFIKSMEAAAELGYVRDEVEIMVVNVQSSYLVFEKKEDDLLKILEEIESSIGKGRPAPSKQLVNGIHTILGAIEKFIDMVNRSIDRQGNDFHGGLKEPLKFPEINSVVDLDNYLKGEFDCNGYTYILNGIKRDYDKKIRYKTGLSDKHVQEAVNLINIKKVMDQ